jgi:phospholipid/cholesterol/gamma-HCH transport system permease protein
MDAIGPWRGQPWRVSQGISADGVIGVQALPMASLTSFSIGPDAGHAVGERVEKTWRAQLCARIGFGIAVRELGPLLVGRDRHRTQWFGGDRGSWDDEGSEEIEALEVMAINPIRFLVVPRFLAMLVMLPVADVFGDCVGMVGGWSICKLALDFPTAAYILRSLEYSDAFDLYSGLIKASSSPG